MPVEIKFNTAEYQDLIKSIEEMEKKYPDIANECMRKVGNQFKKELKANVRKKLHHSKDDYARLMSGFRIRVIGDGMETRALFYGESRKSHDWHLVEDGHRLIEPYTKHTVHLKNGVTFTAGTNPGREIKFIPGIKCVPLTCSTFGESFSNVANKVMDKYVKLYEK